MKISSQDTDEIFLYVYFCIPSVYLIRKTPKPRHFFCILMLLGVPWVQDQQHIFEKTLLEAGCPNLYASFGTFCVKIGLLEEQV